MSSFLKIMAPLSAIGLVAMGTIAFAAEDQSEAKVTQSVRYEVPMLNEDAQSDHDNPLLITRAGRVRLGGKQLRNSGINKVFATIDRAKWTKVAVEPDASVPMSIVLGRLSEFSKLGEYEFHQLDKYKEFAQAKTQAGKVASAPYFAGKLGKYELPIAISYDKKRDQCVVSIGEMTVGWRELYDRSFERLDTIVHSAGGVEAVLEDSSILESLVARVQSQHKTPWRCVAGALYHVQYSGWPFVQFETVSST